MESHRHLSWFRLACAPGTAKRALFIAAIVGPILTLINQGDVILQGPPGSFSWPKAILTFVVPYLVSTVSSVAAARDTPLPPDRN